MTAAQALKAHLIGVTELTAYVGTDIFPTKSPGGIDRFLTYSFRREYEPDLAEGYATETLTIRIWTFDYDEAHAIADILYEELNGFQGVMGGTGGVNVGHCLAIDREDGFAALAPDVVHDVVTLNYSLLYHS